MTLPVSGALSVNAINVELGSAGTTTASLGQASYRSLAGVASGAISMSNFYGKTKPSTNFSFSIASNQTNANLRSLAVSAGWDGTASVTATVNSGVYVYSTSTSTAGLTIDGSWPGGVTLVNNGYIMGMGGFGASNNIGSTILNLPQAGGSAISLGVNATITNNSYIGGGGGGGGAYSGGTSPYNYYFSSGGGGAGGGDGGTTNYYQPAVGGTGGSVGSSGTNGSIWYDTSGKAPLLGAGAGGGGRIFPGTGGQGYDGSSTVQAGTGGGAGGGGGGTWSGYYGPTTGQAGNGGSAGAAGADAEDNRVSGFYCNGGGGGGWGASGGSGPYWGGNILFSTGAVGGKAIALNGFSATRNGSGTTYGAVS